MRTKGLLLVLSLLACQRPNDDFSLSESGGSSGASTSTSTSTTADSSSGLTSVTDSGGCPELAPRAEDVAECELAAPPALNIANHPAFASSCDGTVLTLWARVSESDPDIVELCDQDCGTCDPMSTIDLTDLRYQFLKLLKVVADPGVCMRVSHEGQTLAPTPCTTKRLAVWDNDAPAPRYVIGVDSIDPLPGTGVAIAADAPAYSCACSAGDMSDPLYPCCAQSMVNYFDLVVTPEGGCPLRVHRGIGNLQHFETLGAGYDFILFNAYEYADACPDARDTYFWTMGRVGN